MATRSSILSWKISWTEGAWWPTVHGAARNWTRLSDWAHTHFKRKYKCDLNYISRLLTFGLYLERCSRYITIKVVHAHVLFCFWSHHIGIFKIKSKISLSLIPSVFLFYKQFMFLLLTVFTLKVYNYSSISYFYQTQAYTLAPR